MRRRIEPRGGPAAAAIALGALTLCASLSGCLGEGGDEEDDLRSWFLAMTIDRFLPDGQRPVNLTYLLFEVRFGSLIKDTWMVYESDGFKRGNESLFPLRVEARYNDGVHPIEQFAVMGSSHVVTGAITFKDGRLRATIDGDESLFTVDRSLDRLPHEHELTVTLEGDNGELRLYFNMNKPREL